MKKSLLLAAMLIAGVGAASAETITLGPVSCSIVKQCLAVPNDAGAVIDLYGAPQYPWFFVYIDGVQYIASVPSGHEMVAVPLQSFIFPDPQSPFTHQYTGQFITITGSFSTFVTCTTSGRARHCSTHWNLVNGGTIVR